MSSSIYEAAKPVRLPSEVSVVNAGLPLFAKAITDQSRPVVQLDWRIPGGGDPVVVAALRRLSGPKAALIDAANAEVYRRLDQGVPQAIEVRPAAEVIPALADGRLILHSGPAIDYRRACDPLRRSMRAAVCAEGWAADPEQADALLASGQVRTDSANLHQVVVPMATAMGPRTPVWVVELAEAGIRTFAPLGQGSGDVAWFGKDSPGAIERLVLLRDAAGPVMADALTATGPLNVLSIAAQAVAMGDDVHVRVQASTNLLLRTLLPALVGGTHPRRVELGVTPKVTTGILHNSDGSGQIGAGVAVAPIEVFIKALMDLDARIP